MNTDSAETGRLDIARGWDKDTFIVNGLFPGIPDKDYDEQDKQESGKVQREPFRRHGQKGRNDEAKWWLVAEGGVKSLVR